MFCCALEKDLKFSMASYRAAPVDFNSDISNEPEVYNTAYRREKGKI